MKSLGRQTEPRSFAHTLDALHGADDAAANDAPRPLAPARWDWRSVRRVLVVRLRSIGDTVLATPSLYALRRFLPSARIDVLLEDWVAPLLEGSELVDRVVTVERKSNSSRLRVARQLRAEMYDVVYNLHGGSTAALLTRATGAPHRVGYADYSYASLHNHAAPPSSMLWGREKTHSAEQQLALIGWTGVPVTDRPSSRLAVTHEASAVVARRLREEAGLTDAQPFALIHPAAAFDTKTWAAENFARVIEHLAARGLASVAVVAPGEAKVIEDVRAHVASPLAGFNDLRLPELTALAARASVFVGNDSGVAHVAAAMGTPQVVVFGSSNVAHWRPWTEAPAEVVREEMPCAPCPGYTCAEFGEPECIRRVPVERVLAAVERVLSKTEVVTSDDDE
ncbi:MAG: heptosyltransferase [Acidobacteriota bacterium]|jgi:lipopolysaccharide heptosyltransferase II|nr:heptosyltransferase [Acidobacteriota bacterium]MDT7810055.1 heptosyltransferase [Acidobacteriota bacterium]